MRLCGLELLRDEHVDMAVPIRVRLGRSSLVWNMGNFEVDFLFLPIEMWTAETATLRGGVREHMHENPFQESVPF